METNRTIPFSHEAMKMYRPTFKKEEPPQCLGRYDGSSTACQGCRWVEGCRRVIAKAKLQPILERITVFEGFLRAHQTAQHGLGMGEVSRWDEDDEREERR